MDCDDVLPLLPLAALAALDPDAAAAVASHALRCARCAMQLAELARTRAALGADTVAAAAPTDVDELVEDVIGATPRREQGGSRFPRRAAAAAVLLFAALVAGFSGGRFATVTVSESHAALSLDPDAVEHLARAVLRLDDRLTEFERRHERDLMTLARTIDQTQEERDRGFTEQLTTLAALTGREIKNAREAVHVISRQLPIAAVAADRNK